MVPATASRRLRQHYLHIGRGIDVPHRSPAGPSVDPSAYVDPSANQERFVRSIRTTCLFLVLLTPLSGVRLKAADLLTIGSVAPPLNVEHWVQNGNGRFEPVTQFEPKKIYVVEFWATWCGPCIQSMPHLAELQRKYADQGVQIVSVSDEELPRVEKFLEKKVSQTAHAAAEADDSRPATPTTYRQLTSAYCLTADPDQSTHQDYMHAAAQNSIPMAFIVGKDGRIEWFGHPIDLEQPLAEIVENRWDREAYGKVVRAQQEAERAMQTVYGHLEERDYDSAVQVLDKLIAQNSSQQNSSLQLKGLKLQVLIAGNKIDEANRHLKSMYQDVAEDPETTGLVAWNTYEMCMQGGFPSKDLVATSIAATQVVVDQSKGELKGYIMDTLARLTHLSGDLKGALAIETEALKVASKDDREFMQQFIDQLKKELAAKPSPTP